MLFRVGIQQRSRNQPSIQRPVSSFTPAKRHRTLALRLRHGREVGGVEYIVTGITVNNANCGCAQLANRY
jgi:hypothetical protein